jgi:hypothetical protein
MVFTLLPAKAAITLLGRPTVELPTEATCDLVLSIRLENVLIKVLFYGFYQHPPLQHAKLPPTTVAFRATLRCVAAPRASVSHCGRRRVR